MTNVVMGAVYAKGLSDERRVKTFLVNSLQLTVTPPTINQDRFEDTDCFVNGSAVSIKAQHSGIVYGNICFELSQHLTSHKDCPASAMVTGSRNITQKDLTYLESVGSWEASWYHNGKAEYYYILQGDTLRIYKKADIVNYVNTTGFLRIRPLSCKRQSYQGGSYRYCNAVCGYIPIHAVPHVQHFVNDFTVEHN